MFLILPCDWRFLPKLGPLRFSARATSLLPRSKEPVTLFWSEMGHKMEFYLSKQCCDAQ
jgi:hypothetical protein